jgi:hypothetical protein
MNWPLNDDARACPDCGNETWRNTDAPDKTIAELRAAIAARPSTTPTPTAPASPAHAHRVERYLDMGFTEVDAQIMATSRDARGFFLYHGDVRRCLEAGATHAQMVAIHA